MKECHVCRRNTNEIIAKGETLGYEPIILEKSQKKRERLALIKYNFWEDFDLYICVFCEMLISEMVIQDLLNRIGIGEFEDEDPKKKILTEHDLRNVRFIGKWKNES